MKALFLPLVLLALLPALCLAQASSDGTDFYIGCLRPSYNDQTLSVFNNVKDFYATSVVVSSYFDNEITVSYFDATGQETVSQTLPIKALNSVQVPLDQSKMQLTATGEVAEFKSMHITSLTPVSIQFYSTGANSGGNYLAIPTKSLGKNYVVESYHDNPTGKGGLLSKENSCGYFMVIATFDNTTLQITPTTTTKGGKAGTNHGVGSNGTPQPFTITLNRGQCYMVKSSSGSESFDISGTTVISDKPIALISGHENAFTDSSNVSGVNVDARDFMIEQMIPVELWDNTGYVSIPFVDSKNTTGGQGDEYIAYYGRDLNPPANYPSAAEIKIDAVLKSPIMALANPSMAEGMRSVTSPINAFSTNGAKFHIVQYDQRMQGVSPTPAPSQMNIIPISKWKASYIWSYPSSTQAESNQNYYVNIICDKDDYINGTLQLIQDGGTPAPLKSVGTTSGTKSIPGHPELIGMTIRVSPSKTFCVRSTTKTSFIAYNYGFRTIDPEHTIGDFNGGDHFFSFAAPAGFGVPGQDFSGVIESSLTVSEALAYLSDHSLIIKLPQTIGNVSIALYDLLGRKATEWPNEGASSVLTLPLPSISSGVYMVKIQSQQLNTICKILVQ